jgi:hypothetical protein
VRSLVRIGPLVLALGVQSVLPEGPLAQVLMLGFFLLWAVGLLLGLVRPRRAPLHDRITGTHVVYALDRA